MIVKEGNVTFYDYANAEPGHVDLQPGANPKQLDVYLSRQKTLVDRAKLGIYKVEGDEWTICLAGPGKPRPQAFDTRPGAAGGGSLLFVLRRDQSHSEAAEPAKPILIGMNEEFGMLFEGRLVAPAELSRLLTEALAEDPNRVVAIDLPKRRWTVVGHVDQLEQIARITGAKNVTRPEWSVIRIRFGVIKGGGQFLDIKGPGYSASGFVESYLPNVREVIDKNPGLPVLLDIAEGVDLHDARIAESFDEVRRVAEATGAKVRLSRVSPRDPPPANPARPSEYFQRLTGEPLEAAVRERVGGDVGRKITAERIPQPAGRIRYEAQIDGVGSKILEPLPRWRPPLARRVSRPL